MENSMKKEIMERIELLEKEMDMSKQRHTQYKHLMNIETSNIIGMGRAIDELKKIVSKETLCQEIK